MPRVTTCIVLTIGLITAGFMAAATPQDGVQIPSPSSADNDSPPAPLPAKSVGHPTFVSPHSRPIVISAGRVFVANTPADTVDVIDVNSRTVVSRINVGIDPVSMAVRPDGKELWVSNHVSDSVSVIDIDVDSSTYLSVVATIQEFDAKTKATRFDEPVGVAFASNEKAYVALSSENQIAVVDVATRDIIKRLTISAQDPRAIAVRGDRLYVIPFESNNQTQLSGGSEIDGDLVTFNAWEHSIIHNVFRLGHVVDIVKHPKVPDRDPYVFDTKTDALIETVDTLGTLLYGLTVDSHGRVFIAQTDARNDINGRSGTKKHGLKEMENRAFLNRITTVDAVADGAGSPEDRIKFFDLEPLPPEQPQKEDALATPFAIEISGDDTTLLVSAAGSDRLFTVDASSGEVLGRTRVEAVPRGIALQNTTTGKANQAWVLNAVSNTVSLVDVADAGSPSVIETIRLQDPTHPVVKRGRMAFETAESSTNGTFSCASCHPDGHTDQLLWVLNTPVVTGGDQIMPRSTMPIRGLRDTAPFHWDGIPGDPYGGNNSANVHGSDPPNCSLNHPESAARHLIDGGIAATMSLVGDETVNDEGKAGALTASERDAMAVFLLNVPYPPAQRRAYTNVVSDRAADGFRLFHIDGDHDEKPRPNVCGDCHRMPFLVSTNTPGTGMDAPTWRGAYDRFLILPQGRLNIIDFDFYERVAQRGQPERDVWQFSWAGRQRFNPVWDMVLEGSTGFSGSFARQLTLSKSTASGELTADLLSALELSAAENAVVLEVEGVLLGASQNSSGSETISLQFQRTHTGGTYVERNGARRMFQRSKLVKLASDGHFVGTFTARHGVHSDVDHPQPALWTHGPIEQQRGRQRFPILYQGRNSMTVSGRHLDDSTNVIVDGRRVSGNVIPKDNETVVIELTALPEEGMHLLQLQNFDGQFTNDFIFHVTRDAAATVALKDRTDREHEDIRDAIAAAIANGDFEQTERLLTRAPKRINDQRPTSGSTPLSEAALRGQAKLVKLLLRRGAKVDATNRDGNTPLIVAAFLCREEIVKLLLEAGGSRSQKNQRGETPLDVVSGPWNDELAALYTGIGQAIELEIDLKRIERERPVMAALLEADTKTEP